MGNRDNWAYIQTPILVFEEVQRILDNPEWKNLGIAKPKDIALILLRKWIEENKDSKGPRIISKHHFEIKSKELGKKIKFSYFQDEITCSDCNSTECIHALSAWTDKDIRKEMESRGIKLPNNDVMKEKQILLESLKSE